MVKAARRLVAMAGLFLFVGAPSQVDAAGEVLRPTRTLSPDQPNQGVAVSPDATRLALLGTFGARVEILSSNGSMLRKIDRSGLVVTPEIAFVDDRTVVVAAGYEASRDAMLEVWEATGGVPARVIVGPNPGRGEFYNRAQLLALSTDHGLAVVLTSRRRDSNGSIQLVDTSDWQVKTLNLRTWLGPFDNIGVLAASSRSGPVAIGTVGGRLLLVNPIHHRLIRDQRIYRMSPGSPSVGVYAVAFSPDGRFIATGRTSSMTSTVDEHYGTGPDGPEGLKVWDVASGTLIRSASATKNPVRHCRGAGAATESPLLLHPTSSCASREIQRSLSQLRAFLD